LTTWTSAMTALWINNPGFDTDHRHRHRGGMLTKTPPPTKLQIPATVTTLVENFEMEPEVRGTSGCGALPVGYNFVDSQPFRSRANSLPGANRPIEPWPIRSLELSLPGLVTWLIE